MGNYDNIQIPVKGQNISQSQYGTRVRDAILNLDARASILEANFSLPAPVNGGGSGNNTITSAVNTWATLTTTPASCVMTNPSADFDLYCDVFFGAWMLTSAGDVRMGLALSGGVTITPGPAPVNQPVGWGLFPTTSFSTTDQHMGFFQAVIPAGAAAVTFTAQGYRSNGSATAQINYPTIYVVPRTFR